MEIPEMNRAVFAFENSHPAKQFLVAFMECRENCVGRHHDFDGIQPIEQEWQSSVDGRKWSFSEFAYTYLSTDVELDGYLNQSPTLTESEIYMLEFTPKLRTLMMECERAAQASGNTPIVELTKQVLEMLHLLEVCIRFREATIGIANADKN